MKACDECLVDGVSPHPSSKGCHWLDGDTACPHCGGALRWFRGTPVGDVMDELSMGLRGTTE